MPSWTVSDPTAPEAPRTARRSPGRSSPTMRSATSAAVAGEKNVAAAGISTPRGTGISATSRTAASSAQVPFATTPRPAPRNQTSAPLANRVDRRTTPAPSTPGTYGSGGCRKNPPLMISRSTCPTAAATIRTSASPSAGTGSGTSSTTGGSPHAWTRAASTSAPGEPRRPAFEERLEPFLGVLGPDELEHGLFLDGEPLEEQAV